MSRRDPRPGPVPLTDAGALDDALASPRAVLFKHSPYCGLSARAADQVQRFCESHPDVPVYLVDVVRDRPLSMEVARRLGVRHESPQAMVVRDGRVAWSASHAGVTTAALAREWAAD